jgi:chromatin segregation and condensation protein Rec8/ScpA/Scc1 (kleisin family)
VVTLLALLELVRLGEARARQAELFGEIVIERNAVSVREPARAIEEQPEIEEHPENEPRPESGESLNA